MTRCVYCGKPKYNPVVNATVTTTSTVWPFCQCNTITFTFIQSPDATALANALFDRMAAYEKKQHPEKIEVPQAFQEAFGEGELEL